MSDRRPSQTMLSPLTQLLKPAEAEETLTDLALRQAVTREGRVRGYALGVDARCADTCHVAWHKAVLTVLCSIWINSFAQAYSRGSVLTGMNPELCTLFYRLARLAALPVAVVFVFDGPSRPAIKWDRAVLQGEYFLATHLKEFANAFGFFEHTMSAPPQSWVEPPLMDYCRHQARRRQS